MTASSWRTAPLPDDWPIRRIRVLRRDSYRCQTREDDEAPPCGRPARAVDHVIPASQGGSDELENLAAICDWHHARKTAQEAAQARKPRPSRRRPREAHPGLL